MRIGIVGGGFVGSATALLECKDIDVVIYDMNPARCKPVGTTLEDLKNRDFVFVCVPTPTYEDGSCNTNIVNACIANLKENEINNIVLRSTVPPGTADALDVMFMPEFLTEANWRNDFYNCHTWVFGGHRTKELNGFQELLRLASQNNRIASTNVQLITPKEAELVKYTRNNFLALKISFFNEIHSLCTAIGVDYGNVISGVTCDPRIGKSHTAVPGPDGHAGFGGTCLPKDTSALGAFMKSKSVPSPIIDAMVYRNKHLDRPERDWESDPRAFTKKTT
jgi:UDPglucose 6-dehydrogenase